MQESNTPQSAAVLHGFVGVGCILYTQQGRLKLYTPQAGERGSPSFRVRHVATKMFVVT